MLDFYWKYYLAIKYWFQGDSWSDAIYLADYIVKGFKR